MRKSSVAVFFALIISCASAKYFHETKAGKFCALRHCRSELADNYEYKQFYSLRDIPGARNLNDGISLTVFVIGEKNANILLTPTKLPENEKPAYEFVIGGKDENGNEGVFIRTAKHKYNKSGIRQIQNLLTQYEPNEVNIRITTDGQIHIIINQCKHFYYQSDFIDVKYMAFSGFNTPVEFHFNCTETI